MAEGGRGWGSDAAAVGFDPLSFAMCALPRRSRARLHRCRGRVWLTRPRVAARRSKGDARYSFIVEWYDTAASLTRQYQLIFYTSDGTLEMVSRGASDRGRSSTPARGRGQLTPPSPPSPAQYDLKNRRSFLKRCDYPGVREADLFKGSIITVYSRQLTVKDYADAFTASAFESSSKMCALAAIHRPPRAGSASAP